jgi:hypothetical protein
VTAWHRRSGGAASARLSPANAGVVAANFETAPLAQADVFAGQKRDADRLERAPDQPGDSRQGARRSASKSSIALALTEAADASFATDQPSRARAERHWAAEIIALGVQARYESGPLRICFTTPAQ